MNFFLLDSRPMIVGSTKGKEQLIAHFPLRIFFLEIVWVHNEQEIKSDLVRPTGLWQRAAFFKNNFSPFGLIIENNEESDYLFENAYKYQPGYFPDGMAFDILQNSLHPDLPWTCRLPFKREKNAEGAKVNHNNGLKSLTKSTFQYLGSGSGNGDFFDIDCRAV